MKRTHRRRRSARVGTVDVLVVGAGHAGLAVSRCLDERAIDHVVLERGEVANAWRRERWDSLRLLTPNWQCRLPGHRYAGPEPDGFMRAREVVDFLGDYARRIAAPVRAHTRVTAVEPFGRGHRVSTEDGAWRCRAVVLASGAFNRPVVPAAAAGVPGHVVQRTPHAYRNPRDLPDGGVLVVGASATGLQLADEIQRSGRQVVLSVGEHVRMPRTYRGRDIQWWMHEVGLLDERWDQVDDLTRARRVPSPQLVGSDHRETLDLNALRERGVGIVGRLADIREGRARFSGSLRNHCALADLKLSRLVDRFDAWAEARGRHEVEPPERFAPTLVDPSPRLEIDLAGGEIRSIVWATGFRPDYTWLRAPVLDRKGGLRHQGGVVAAPGMYAMGLPFMRRRKSSFLHGAEDDARDLCAHLAAHLDACARAETRIAVA
jgi:putative flavoprotein involved in K+ transport